MGDNNKQARIMSGLWDTVRRAELRRHPWSFAMKRAALPALSSPPAWGYSTAFQLPADFLRVVQVNDFYVSPSETDYRTMDDSPYAIEGGTLLASFPAPLKVRYVADIADPGAFDAMFVEALAAKLAYEACEGITQANEKKNVASEDYKAAIKAAAHVNAIEKPAQGIADDAWMTSRL
jgi:hypothetical protein